MGKNRESDFLDKEWDGGVRDAENTYWLALQHAMYIAQQGEVASKISQEFFSLMGRIPTNDEWRQILDEI
ncbi:MAG: hypothetical protein NUV98_00995 [Candidatus Roizmanbacteria bacterium]|nr:hypothetical protein [Candidatus Roizmanbacteria bacterium]